jgi:hypothetical protein
MSYSNDITTLFNDIINIVKKSVSDKDERLELYNELVDLIDSAGHDVSSLFGDDDELDSVLTKFYELTPIDIDSELKDFDLDFEDC